MSDSKIAYISHYGIRRKSFKGDGRVVLDGL